MKKNFFLLSLLIAFTTQAAPKEHLILTHDAIKLVDGTQLIDIREMAKIILGLQNLIRGEKIVGSKETNPLVTFEGKKYTINDLVALEKTKKLPPKAIAKSIDDALSIFEGFSANYMMAGKGYKQQTLTLLAAWSELAKRPKTLLLNWGQQKEGTEHEEMRAMITNFSQLASFCNDLASFLNTMVNSCTKSKAAFVAAQIKVNDGKKEL